MSELPILSCMADAGGQPCGQTKLVIRKSRHSGLALCSRHYDRERYRANLAANPNYNRERRAKNPEGYRAAVRKYRLAHPEEARERDRRSSVTHAVKIAARNKARYDSRAGESGPRHGRRRIQGRTSPQQPSTATPHRLYPRPGSTDPT